MADTQASKFKDAIQTTITRADDTNVSEAPKTSPEAKETPGNTTEAAAKDGVWWATVAPTLTDEQSYAIDAASKRPIESLMPEIAGDKPLLTLGTLEFGDARSGVYEKFVRAGDSCVTREPPVAENR
jgi:hypothetical protein